MSLLVESIWINKGKPINFPYHQARFNSAIRSLFGTNPNVDIRIFLSELPEEQRDYKLRLLYDATHIQSEWIPYERRAIESVQLIYDDNLSYDYKYADRPQLDQHFSRRGQADEIIIIKNGWVTDAYYFNVVIEKDKLWFTPSIPLLRGVMRQYYLDKGVVKEANISITDLMDADEVFLINALNPLHTITIKDIIP